VARRQDQVTLKVVDGGAAGRWRRPAQRAQRQHVSREVEQELQAVHGMACTSAAGVKGLLACLWILGVQVPILLLLLLLLLALLFALLLLPRHKLEDCNRAVPTPNSQQVMRRRRQPVHYARQAAAQRPCRHDRHVRD
jgi:hypothetical protein